MKPPQPAHHRAQATLRLLWGLLFLALIPVVIFAAEPAWWSERSIKTANPANDYAAVNQGQLKNIAKAAATELDASLPGGAEDAVHSLVNNWSAPTANTNDYAPVNLGQLKTVAKPFYDRLSAVGYTGTPLTSGQTYPWDGKEAAANDYAMANIGQVKNVFSFDITYDGDGNRLPDWWEFKYFGVSGQNPDALAPRGDGLTILQTFEQGLNPIDFYNGNLPTLSVVSGGNQRAEPGTILALPVSVSIGGVYNAPITFTVTSGSALISATNGNSNTPVSTVAVRSINQYWNASGNLQNVAQIYIYLPSNPADLSIITATVASGTQTVSISTTAATTDPTLAPPTNLTATPTSPTTIELTWTSTDTNQPTTIQTSYDGGINWVTVGVVPAGIDTATITGLTPDVPVDFRVITGNCSRSDPSGDPTFPMPSPSEPVGTPNSGGAPAPGNTAGGGSSPSSSISVQTLSQPVIVGQKITTWGTREIFPGFVNPSTQYYKKRIYYASSGSGTRTVTTTFDPQTQAYTSGTVTSGVGAGGVSGNWVIESDTYKFRSDSKGHFESYALDEEYTLPQFISDVENLQPEYTSDFIDELCDAHILLTEDNLWYEYSKLRYKFRVNKDPNGTITWYAKFMPYKNGYGTAYDLEGSNVRYDIGNMATNGATEVPSPLGFIDPLHDSKFNPDKQNGKYEVGVLPIEIAVDANRDGVIKLSGTNTGLQGGVQSDGLPIDSTTMDKPYRFWINDDHDDPSDGDVIDGAHDYNNGNITCIRDLEDYARLWLNVGCVTNMMRYSGIKVGLQFKPVSGETWAEGEDKPAIKIFPAYETDGGGKYLTDGTTANYQIGGVYDVPVKNTQGGSVVSTDPFFFTTEFFDGMWWNYNTIKHLLFEGVHEGKGKLVMVFYKGDQKIGEGGSLYLDLKNVKKMYERAKGTPEDGIAVPWSDENPMPTDFVLDANGNAFDKPADEEEDVIIFVHGIHPPLTTQASAYNGCICTAETVFKRLWHSGYKGRFAFYKWPAMTPAAGVSSNFGFDFNQSEYRAWKYGRGLKEFVSSMPADYGWHILSHSQGNAVVGAAIRSYGLAADTWIPTNGAIPISCYDSDEKHLVLTYDQPTPDSGTSLGYRGYLEGRVNARVINFCNPADSVTKYVWELNQKFWKPNNDIAINVYNTYSYDSYADKILLSRKPFPDLVYHVVRTVTDRHEGMAMAVQSMSKAIGQAAGGNDVGSVVESNIDINTTFSLGGTHSAQWDLDIQHTMPYYQKIVTLIHE